MQECTLAIDCIHTRCIQTAAAALKECTLAIETLLYQHSHATDARMMIPYDR